MNLTAFDAKDVELKGISLIEASAGTGKTYSIAALFLRFVLEGIPVRSILAVTFTQAATAELKARVLNFLKVALKYSKNGEISEDDALIKEIVDHYKLHSSDVAKKLRNAVTEFDESSIFTIHGFCKRVISENAFESGSLFNMELTQENEEILDDALTFFWRKYTALADKEFLLNAVSMPWFSFDEIKRIVKGKLFSQKPVVANPKYDLPDKLSWEKEPSIIGGGRNDFCVDALILLDRLFDELKDIIADKRDQTGLMGFDDLLVILEEVLQNKSGEMLIKTMGQKYEAVLIDEFQDTDPVQYNIFRKLFGNKENTLFYIGDPKQSIYGFRNADIFAYFKVKERVEQKRKYSMRTNYRSCRNAVEAVNTVFGMAERPFLIGDIPFEKVSSYDDENLSEFLCDGQPVEGLKIKFSQALERSRDKQTGSVKNPRIKAAPAKEIAIEDMCFQIVEMLSFDSKYSIKGKPVKASDIAVLVLKNDDADLVKRNFEKYSIPAALSSNASVFQSDEAKDMLIIMDAVRNPAGGRIKAALLTMFFNKEITDIEALEADHLSFEGWHTFFSQMGEKWHDHGFLSFFTALLEKDDAYLSLAKYENGERRLTNVRHLIELVQKHESEKGVAVDSTFLWFASKMKDEKRGEEEQLRLERDESAVQILTVHKSKGLQFGIVFCPYFVKKGDVKEAWHYYYHDEAGDQVLSLDRFDKEASSRLEQEVMSENLRLLYVALTRAKYTTFLYWGKINQAGTTPMAYLFHGITNDTSFNKTSDETLFEDIEKISKLSDGAISAENSLEEKVFPLIAGQISEKLSGVREMTAEIKRDWSVTSFSALTSVVEKDSSGLKISDKMDEFEEVKEIEQGDLQPQDISFFPAGATAGTVLHTIFEEIDFSSDDNEKIITEILEKHRMRKHKNGDDMVPWVKECVNSVLDATLFEKSSLRDVNKEDLSFEMEFFYKIDSMQNGDIVKLLKDKVNLPEGKTSGFIHGFMDLVFRHNGKYYLVDWKSNRLGDGLDDYKEDKIKKEMAKHNYILQYMLYLAALDKYLKQSDPAYSYENNFGGVYYFFIRGISEKNNFSTGIYRDLPTYETVEKLQGIMGNK
jgi:exodeoxyribonuclease V beta subunit